MEEILEVIGGSAGWIIGVGITLGLASTLTGGAKPLAKKAIKGYLSASERLRVTAAEWGENLQDLYAEARMEYDTSQAAANGARTNTSVVVPGGDNI
ncbi:MAG TPA: DUF5132 domain-containing protein [Armatimonadota bacterium]|nr:DUF5132 domain-containing protein [Armatimonadota bacterium]